MNYYLIRTEFVSIWDDESSGNGYGDDIQCECT